MSADDIKALLEKSKQSLDASKHLLSDGFTDFAASRAYYAMFYSLEALFLSRDKSFSKHSSIISEFGKEFIKTGIFDKKFHQFLLEAFDVRNAGDYGVINSVDRVKANDVIDKAEEFITVITDYLSR